jgi:hypothetical protein
VALIRGRHAIWIALSFPSGIEPDHAAEMPDHRAGKLSFAKSFDAVLRLRKSRPTAGVCYPLQPLQPVGANATQFHVPAPARLDVSSERSRISLGTTTLISLALLDRKYLFKELRNVIRARRKRVFTADEERASAFAVSSVVNPSTSRS